VRPPIAMATTLIRSNLLLKFKLMAIRAMPQIRKPKAVLNCIGTRLGWIWTRIGQLANQRVIVKCGVWSHDQAAFL
jgi:hypothetical protein